MASTAMEYKECHNGYNTLYIVLGVYLITIIIVLVIVFVGSIIHPAFYAIASAISFALPIYLIYKRIDAIKLSCYNYGLSKQ